MFKAIDFFFHWTGNFGLAILIVTVLVKLADGSRSAESYIDLSEALSQISSRQEAEIRRYRIRYGVNVADPRNYDLLIRTDDLSIEQVGEAILSNWEKQEARPQVITSPMGMHPTKQSDVQELESSIH